MIVNFRGKNHLAAARTIRDHTGGIRHLPACGSWNRRCHEYPIPVQRDGEDVTCQKCQALAAK